MKQRCAWPRNPLAIAYQERLNYRKAFDVRHAAVGMTLFVLLLALAAVPVWAAYEANGVALGATEKEVVQQYPSAHCQPLQWTSRAADRRCDDARIVLGGVSARITFYLKNGRVQAFDIGFSPRDAERLVAFLKPLYGAPVAETRDKLGGDAKAEREIYKVRWESANQRAVLTAQTDRRRGTLSVSRGDFEEEIYRVR